MEEKEPLTNNTTNDETTQPETNEQENSNDSPQENSVNNTENNDGSTAPSEVDSQFSLPNGKIAVKLSMLDDEEMKCVDQSLRTSSLRLRAC